MVTMKDDFEEECDLLYLMFIKRGYPASFLNIIFQEVKDKRDKGIYKPILGSDLGTITLDLVIDTGLNSNNTVIDDAHSRQVDIKKKLQAIVSEMITSNGTISLSEEFVLSGFPGIQGWVSIPFCTIYVLTLLGNCTILLVIKHDEALQEPMYMFIFMLATADIALSSTVLPRMLVMLWFDANSIRKEACFLQMFFVHSFAIMASSVLLAMSFDRYFAICYPLQYANVFSKSLIKKIATLCITRGFILIIPAPVLASNVSYCSANVLPTSYCDFMSLIKIGCSESTFNSVYGLTVPFVVIADVGFIMFSYAKILSTVLKLGSSEERQKAINTCGSHLLVLLFTYITAFFSFITHRFVKGISPPLLVVFSSLYMVLPAMLNPIIYGVRTNEIRKNIFKRVYTRKRSFHWKFQELYADFIRFIKSLGSIAVF
ncbi:olfactory receptor 52K1-like [Protopterus annectens]|uniref:olfactory receptor 52K1-like n=1 Tax=Protopterus annectens TaxID=7888 RepID=UPI001CFAEC5C|nr:olfactory receptor 52K1-like [Protopterus annectens]